MDEQKQELPQKVVDAKNIVAALTKSTDEVSATKKARGSI